MFFEEQKHTGLYANYQGVIKANRSLMTRLQKDNIVELTTKPMEEVNNSMKAVALINHYTQSSADKVGVIKSHPCSRKGYIQARYPWTVFNPLRGYQLQGDQGLPRPVQDVVFKMWYQGPRGEEAGSVV